MVPFSRLGDHSANHWFPYQTPYAMAQGGII
ncbi:hypothetical protein EFM18_05115 [Limosilactobacillus fermentum]|nr:hypothetical protein [Limosilactobacillus fermentum]